MDKSTMERIEEFLEAIANSEAVEEASQIYKGAWDEACEKVEVPAATAAILMMAASAVSGAPAVIQAGLLSIFVETLNSLSGREVLSIGTPVSRAEMRQLRNPAAKA